jgi:hypothetical protein
MNRRPSDDRREQAKRPLAQPRRLHRRRFAFPNLRGESLIGRFPDPVRVAGPNDLLVIEWIHLTDKTADPARLFPPLTLFA